MPAPSPPFPSHQLSAPLVSSVQHAVFLYIVVLSRNCPNSKNTILGLLHLPVDDNFVHRLKPLSLQSGTYLQCSDWKNGRSGALGPSINKRPLKLCNSYTIKIIVKGALKIL